MLGRDEPSAREYRDVLRPVVYGIGAAFGTYLVGVLLLGIQIARLAPGTTGGLESRAFLFGTFGDFFAVHYGAAAIEPGVAQTGGVTAVAYGALPAAILCWAGWQAAAASATSGRTAVLTGAAVTVGYVATVGAALAFAWLVVEGGLVRIDPVRVLLIAGVAYPLICGSLGGYLATWSRSGVDTGRDENP